MKPTKQSVVDANFGKSTDELMKILKSKGMGTTRDTVNYMKHVSRKRQEKKKLQGKTTEELNSELRISLIKKDVEIKSLRDRITLNDTKLVDFDLVEKQRDEWRRKFEKANKDIIKISDEYDDRNHKQIKIVMELNNEIKEKETLNRELTEGLLRPGTKITDLQGELNQAKENQEKKDSNVTELYRKPGTIEQTEDVFLDVFKQGVIFGVGLKV